LATIPSSTKHSRSLFSPRRPPHLHHPSTTRFFTQPSILFSTVDPLHHHRFFTQPSTHELDPPSYPQATCTPW
jgi:hypothetical protein